MEGKGEDWFPLISEQCFAQILLVLSSEYEWKEKNWKHCWQYLTWDGLSVTDPVILDLVTVQLYSVLQLLNMQGYTTVS